MLVEVPPTYGIVNVASALQPDNAPLAILVTLVGIVMFLTVELFLKQFSYISTTVLLDNVDGFEDPYCPIIFLKIFPLRILLNSYYIPHNFELA